MSNVEENSNKLPQTTERDTEVLSSSGDNVNPSGNDVPVSSGQEQVDQGIDVASNADAIAGDVDLSFTQTSQSASSRLQQFNAGVQEKDNVFGFAPMDPATSGQLATFDSAGRIGPPEEEVSPLESGLELGSEPSIFEGLDSNIFSVGLSVLNNNYVNNLSSNLTNTTRLNEGPNGYHMNQDATANLQARDMGVTGLLSGGAIMAGSLFGPIGIAAGAAIAVGIDEAGSAYASQDVAQVPSTSGAMVNPT